MDNLKELERNKYGKSCFGVVLELSCFLLLILTLVVSTIIYFSLSLPQISTLGDYKPPIPSQILSKRGVVLAEIGVEKREIVKMEDIPKVVIDAFLSAEDDSFYEHKGVDYLGVLRALIVNIKAGKVVQGGSTITQQVANLSAF